MRKNMSAVYILTNATNSVLYTGVTSNLQVRLSQHLTKSDPDSFSARYNLKKLVWYDWYYDIRDAIAREKKIKAGSRADKIRLIEGMNPEWLDLVPRILGPNY